MPVRSRWRAARLLVPFLLAVGPLACVPGDAAGGRESAPADVVACPDPRPEVCIQVHDPVCGCTTADCVGGERTTYSNHCIACRHPKVAAYRPGACEGEA